MTIQTKQIDYYDGDVLLEGFCAYPDSNEDKATGCEAQSGNGLPGVLICHDWSGRNEFACEKAKAIAKLGYVGFAIDMYGKGKLGTTKEEKSELIKPFIEDRAKLARRIEAGLHELQSLEQVNENNIAAIGFCFGGLCVLDLARTGAPVRGTISIHGLLSAPPFASKQINGRVLVLHGFDDPMVTPDQVMHFGEEMTQAKADWEIDVYGHTMHAFTNPLANDPGFGTVYSKKADERSWQTMKLFFAEIFGVK